MEFVECVCIGVESRHAIRKLVQTGCALAPCSFSLFVAKNHKDILRLFGSGNEWNNYGALLGQILQRKWPERNNIFVEADLHMCALIKEGLVDDQSFWVKSYRRFNHFERSWRLLCWCDFRNNELALLKIDLQLISRLELLEFSLNVFVCTSHVLVDELKLSL